MKNTSTDEGFLGRGGNSEPILRNSAHSPLLRVSSRTEPLAEHLTTLTTITSVLIAAASRYAALMKVLSELVPREDLLEGPHGAYVVHI